MGYSSETICVHGAYDPSKHNRSRAVPLYQSAAFTYDSSDHAAGLFALEEEGYIYMRLNNPTVDEAEKRVALLEGGLGSVGFASGMAASSGFLLNFLRQGDEVLAANCLYGGSTGLLKDTLPSLGITAVFFDPLYPEKIESLITSATRLILVENLANPILTVPDIAAYAAIAHKHKLPLAVDNTVATPLLSRPFLYGADFVIHSCTKYMEGHGNIIGGMVVDSGTYCWDKERYPLMFDPAPSGQPYYEKYGSQAFLTRLRGKVLMNLGGCMAPFHAYMLIHGLESLHVRIERHCQNALAIARWLEKHPRVAWVCYPGLSSHPYYLNAQKYLGGMFGGMIGFGLKGGFTACKQFIDNVKLLSHTTNIGDAKTLVIHPASTTHRNLSAEDKKAVGITDDFIRLSVGLEKAEDLMAEMDKAIG